MIKIRSKITNGVIHIVHRVRDIVGNQRNNICDDDKYLQVAAIPLYNNQTFIPHKHLPQQRTIEATHESWVVIRGVVKASFYDIDDKFLIDVILYTGDCSITFAGGHTYTCLEDNTLVYEYKNGPFNGSAMDKQRF